MLAFRRPTSSSFSLLSFASFHTSHSIKAELKANIKLIAEIRKVTDNQTSFAKAKEALLATNNDLESALKWLEKDNITSGAKKAAKVANRVANDGLVGIAVLSDGVGQSPTVRAAMVEVNCETDFVARNDIFSKLVADIAHTAAYLAEAPTSPSRELPKGDLFSAFPIDVLADAPLVSPPSSGSSGAPAPDPSNNISSAIRDATSKLGEKISLRRACSFVGPALAPASGLGLRVGSYLHLPGSQAETGKIGALVALALKSKNLQKFTKSGDADTRALARALARQVVGLNAERVQDSGSPAPDSGDGSSTALYSQPFMMKPGGATETSVRSSLNTWAQEKGLASGESGEGVEVLEFVRWTAGEGIEKVEGEGFAEEVRRLSG